MNDTDNQKRICTSCEVSASIKLCSEESIEIDGQVFTPDKTTAFVEFYLSHAFPVVTVDETALHPQVVANSYQSMRWKVFDLAHILKAYDPKAKQDRILGTVVGVEFPSAPRGGWKVQGDKAKAPAIRAVAAMHKNVEGVMKILQSHFTGQMDWTVSMEQEWYMSNSGFLVCEPYSEDPAHEAMESEDWEKWEKETPSDIRKLNWVYVPNSEAPTDLLKCLDAEQSKIVRKWQGRKLIALLGGLDGEVHYQGVGLTPLGKEKEAEVSRMLASEKLLESGGKLVPDVIGLLKKTAELPAAN